MNKTHQFYKPNVNFTGVQLPEHEAEIFGLILKHMFDNYTNRINALLNEPTSPANATKVIKAAQERRYALNLMEAFEGVRGFNDPTRNDEPYIKINGDRISEEMLVMVRIGCENFSRDSHSEYHCKTACGLKKRLTAGALV